MPPEGGRLVLVRACVCGGRGGSVLKSLATSARDARARDARVRARWGGLSGSKELANPPTAFWSIPPPTP